MAEAAKWYVVHTYSGYENTVKATIEKTIETRHLEDLIHIVSIPMETVTEITDNGPKTYDRIDIEKNKVRVIVSMFGRETPVELELDQVELVND